MGILAAWFVFIRLLLVFLIKKKFLHLFEKSQRWSGCLEARGLATWKGWGRQAALMEGSLGWGESGSCLGQPVGCSCSTQLPGTCGFFYKFKHCVLGLRESYFKVVP